MNLLKFPNKYFFKTVLVTLKPELEKAFYFKSPVRCYFRK
jgi:hypothetical protein